MIDMHIHSTYSDGTKNVVEILQLAQELGLKAISFTDHECCDAYEELEKIDIDKYYDGKIVTGIELKSQYKDIVLDILGYGIDYKKMKNYIAECYKGITRANIQANQLKKYYDIGLNNGLVLKPIEELKWNKEKEWASLVFYNELKSHIENKEKVSKDLWESFENFRTNHYHIKGDMFYINKAKDYPKIENILEIIHKSGGKAFIAHIFQYKEIEDKLLELENILEKYNIDGIECYHSIFTLEESEKLLKFAKEHKLLISGGSDYHGDNKPNISLGIGKGNLNIPDEIIGNFKFIIQI